MKSGWALTTLLTSAPAAFSAAPPTTFEGEYVDKKFLNGQAVFELSIHQAGNALDVGFDAAYSDAHGPTPDATGAGKVTGNTAQFTWKDSSGNTGTGTISLTADGVNMSLRPAHVADSSCLVFYRDNIRLKRIGKK